MPQSLVVRTSWPGRRYTSAWSRVRQPGCNRMVAGTSAWLLSREILFAQFNIDNDDPRFLTLRTEAVPSPATAWYQTLSSSPCQETCRERERICPSSGDCCVSPSLRWARRGRGHGQGIWHHRGRAQGWCQCHS